MDNYGVADLELVADFLPIPLDSIRSGGLTGFDIYIKVNNKFVLYRKGSLPFTLAIKDRLSGMNANTLFIKTLQIDNYLEHLEAHLDEVLSRQEFPVEEKAKIIYSSITNTMRGYLASPLSLKHLNRVQKASSGLVYFLAEGHEAFSHLLDRMPSDFANPTHCVNVAIYALSLAAMLEAPNEQYLRDLALGALLHDLGKTKTAVDKFSEQPGDVTDAIRSHPVWGVKLLEEVDKLPPVSNLAILSHQERYDGSGYPFGLGGAKIPVVGRIMAVADVFDALTTRNPYREGMGAFDSLRLMKEEMKGQFDDAIMTRFIMLLARKQRPSF